MVSICPRPSSREPIQLKPDSVDIGNLGGGIDTVKSVKKPADVAAWFNADHQGRWGTAPAWICAAGVRGPVGDERSGHHHRYGSICSRAARLAPHL
ncbi:MAG: hypothetical protein ACLQVM_23720 [Terriglobia bacterium]